MVERICGNSSADVSWRASRGALRYDVMVAAAGGGGERLGCSSSGSTACRLQGLTCGRIYNVSVVAVGDGCSSRSEAVAVRSGEQMESGALRQRLFSDFWRFYYFVYLVFSFPCVFSMM